MKKNLFIAVIVMAMTALSMTGCGGEPEPTTPTKPTITTESLPDGAVGKSYSQTLTATGDTPITWSIETGDTTLPNGLSLNASTGEITGTPTTVETKNFTVKATNATGNATKDLSINIVTPPTLGGTVTISSSGSGIVYDDVLTANVDNIDGKSGSPIFQWLYDNGSSITGATSQQTYTIPKSDVGKKIKVKVTYSGSNGEVTSSSTSEVLYKNLATSGTIAVENHTTYQDSAFTTVGGNGGNTTNDRMADRIIKVYNQMFTHANKTSYPAIKIIIGNANNGEKVGSNAVVTINVESFYNASEEDFNDEVNICLDYAYDKVSP